MTDPLAGPVGPAGLVGQWQGKPADPAATRRSEVAFLANGMGWTEWASGAGGVEVVGFRWRATGSETLEVLDIWCAFGLTAERDAVEWDELEWRGDPAFTVGFALGTARRPPYAPVLHVSTPLGGARDFVLLRADVSFAACPARGVAPDLGVGIEDAVSRLAYDDRREHPKTRP
ncbi:hypothetical protein [Yinghuangia soli]|uniref:Uncharacterized protein n=1 Tax=Yinghuangia soli TaxID=2908204 RepID=A0AA41PZU8_9ACTN|nr:hypothetical protein [Yinghuangia soli]MCF2528380.1 hypothetical protein [Yinghuangia soli]